MIEGPKNPAAQKPKCPGVKVSKCSGAHTSKCSTAQVPDPPVVPEAESPSVQIPKR